ncbi:MAG: hypothetical protein LKI25_06075 [Atopobiaceae bacterium]|jgi:hypothetical protein|nr:hypothetical protein [Atopobiaceae bacterium]MCI2173764.1 hypothetical protein [Atopobiaceae bacterium]MCI2207594.1 hypothetical protein [Atopobiaceae bacterium]
MSRGSGRLPTGVPSDARYVNITELSDTVLEHAARLTVRKGLRVAYLVSGIALGLGAAVYRVAFDGGLFVCACLILLAAILITKQSRLVSDVVSRNSHELATSGERSRTRTTFFTADSVGVLLPGGARTFPYSSFEKVLSDDLILVLVLKDSQGAFPLERSGFVRGSQKDFEASMAHRIGPARDAAADPRDR